MKKVKDILIIITLLLLTGCSICKTNSYKEDIIEKYNEELTQSLGEYKIVDRGKVKEKTCSENGKNTYTTWSINYENGFLEKDNIILNNKDNIDDQLKNKANSLIVDKLRPLLNEYLNPKYKESDQLYIGNIPDAISLKDTNYNLLTTNSKAFIFIKTTNGNNNEKIQKILEEEIGTTINFIIFDKGANSDFYVIQGITYNNKTVTLEDYKFFLEEN